MTTDGEEVTMEFESPTPPPTTLDNNNVGPKSQNVMTESPEEKALRNSVILVQMFMTCESVQELKIFRLVNKLWRDTSTTELLRRDCLEVRLMYSKTDGDFRHDPRLSEVISEEVDLLNSHYGHLDSIVHQLNYTKVTESSHLSLAHPLGRRRLSRFVFSSQPIIKLKASHNDDDDDETSEKRCLTSLTNCLKNSVKWPTMSFTFTGGNLSSTPAQNFLVMADSQNFIKTLSLHSFPYETESRMTKESFKKLLTRDLPNLEHLVIDNGFAYTWDQPWETSRGQLFLPNLKRLTLPLTSQRGHFSHLVTHTVKTILFGAPNLNKLDHISPPYFRAILDSEKIHLVTQLIDFDYASNGIESRLEDYTYFAQACSHLPIISLSVSWPPRVNLNIFDQVAKAQIMTALNKIIKSSQGSLKHFHLSGDLDDLTTFLVLPSMPFLTKLSCVRSSQEVLFPKGAQVNWTLPNLSYFDWRHVQLTPQLVEPLLTVRTVETFDRMTLREQGRLFSMCPNVSSLKIHCFDSSTKHLLENLSSFGLRFLDTLEIIFDRLTPDCHNLDGILTGMPQEVCHRLFCMGRGRRVSNFEDLRTAPYWLGSFTGLKHLKISFISLAEWAKSPAWRRPFPLTFVSGLYAFQLIPGLRVTIGLDKNEAEAQALIGVLYEVAPFAKIVHLSEPYKVVF